MPFFSCMGYSCVTALTWRLFLLVAAVQAAIAPIVVEPSQAWDGNDGPWSSFFLQVGSPEQTIRVLVSTAVPETWVVLEEGCSSSAPLDCNATRGGLFHPNSSSTWNDFGLLHLVVEENLNYTDSNAGEYGFDSLSLGLPGSISDKASSLTHQAIAGIATKQYWLGNLGINPKSMNLSSMNAADNFPSMMSTLKQSGRIPSLSYGYTAGARYRLKQILGSLTLGGYDASRFAPNNVSFTFAPDNSRDLVVSIKSVAANTPNGQTPLLNEPVYAFIDSTVPHIWLPTQACEAFELAFGLELDPTTNLYLVSESLHDALLKQDASVTFSLANTPSAADTVDITLPYAAFDLEVRYPIVENVTRYFPLRRVTSETQYTLGRAFLQEAYLTVDHERSTFSVAQCSFVEGVEQEIKTIQPVQAGHRSSLAKIVVLVVVVVVVLLIIAAIIYMTWRHRRKRQDRKDADAKSDTGDGSDLPEIATKGDKMSHVVAHELSERHLVELETTRGAEMASTETFPEMEVREPRRELHGSRVAHELP